MRILFVGAGAVSAVMGVALEHQKHEIAWLVRPGRRRELQRLLLIEAASGETRCRERPTVFELGEKVPPFEMVIIATRGDQLAGGIEAVQAHARPGAALGIAAASLTGLDEVRAAWPNAPVFSVMPLFSAWPEAAGTWKWWNPPLLKTLVSGDGDAAGATAATQLAAALIAAGIPARATATAHHFAVAALGPGSALLAGWELAGWDVKRLAADAELRHLTATAIGEAAWAVRLEAPDAAVRALAFAPATAIDLLLRAMPLVAPEIVREMWRHHGPKIRGQTREILDRVLRGAEEPGAADGEGRKKVARLRALRDRLPPLA